MDYYGILGLSKSATDAEIKSAYRSKAKEHHPDKGGDANTFKEVSEAYSVLSDPNAKAKYDRFGHSGSQGNTDFNMNDIFSNFGDFFGSFSGQSQGRSHRDNVGRNVQVTVKVNINEVIFGAKKIIKYTRKEKCTPCDGNGGTDFKTCTKCSGSGQINQRIRTNLGFLQSIGMCDDCDGIGEVSTNPCTTCSGVGAVDSICETEIEIPGGVGNGMRMDIPNNGDYVKKGRYGNLYVIIEEIQDPKVIRDGNDILIRANLSISKVVLGGDVIVNTPHGDINIKIEPGTQSGHHYEYSDMGIPMLSNNGSNYGKGNMIIIAEVEIPTKLTEEQRDLFLKIKECENGK